MDCGRRTDNWMVFRSDPDDIASNSMSSLFPIPVTIQLHVEIPSETGGSNITYYVVDVDTVSTFSSTSLITLNVDTDEVRRSFASRRALFAIQHR